MNKLNKEIKQKQKVLKSLIQKEKKCSPEKAEARLMINGLIAEVEKITIHLNKKLNLEESQKILLFQTYLIADSVGKIYLNNELRTEDLKEKINNICPEIAEEFTQIFNLAKEMEEGMKRSLNTRS